MSILAMVLPLTANVADILLLWSSYAKKGKEREREREREREKVSREVIFKWCFREP